MERTGLGEKDHPSLLLGGLHCRDGSVKTNFCCKSLKIGTRQTRPWVQSVRALACMCAFMHIGMDIDRWSQFRLSGIADIFLRVGFGWKMEGRRFSLVELLIFEPFIHSSRVHSSLPALNGDTDECEMKKKTRRETVKKNSVKMILSGAGLRLKQGRFLSLI